MLANLTPIIRRGVIDNTTRGRIVLQLWCARAGAPLHLELQGNCLQDIAGCRVEFELKASFPPSVSRDKQLYQLVESLQRQEGPDTLAGDMTLSRRVRLRRPTQTQINLLSLEFFRGTQDRFIIETDAFNFELSLPTWECNSACASAQEVLNMCALRDHVSAVVETFRGPGISKSDEDMPRCKWDYVLNRAEAYMTVAPTIIDKYAGRPRSTQAEAFVMERQHMLARMVEEVPPSPYTWQVLDFMDPEDAELTRQAMEHPLFECTARLSALVQRYVLEDMEHYRDNADIDTLLSCYAGIISNTLATIMLILDERAAARLARLRANSLHTRMQTLLRLSHALQPKARDQFQHGAEELIAELKTFVCTLRR